MILKWEGYPIQSLREGVSDSVLDMLGIPPCPNIGWRYMPFRMIGYLPFGCGMGYPPISVNTQAITFHHPSDVGSIKGMNSDDVLKKYMY